MFILVSYDIENDKRRTRVARALEAYGVRVQYSVFECNLEPAQLKQMKQRLTRIMKRASEDEAWSIRFYALCTACVKRIEIMGQGHVTRDEDYYIV